ncbi:MAG: putative integral rane protein [Gemmatimonadetes bacterium]|nr:putative integral rane protein [Gemmatimonadota bacterium]
MNTSALARPAAPEPTGRLRNGLWIAQVVLALVFVVTGVLKLTISPADLARSSAGLSLGLIRFIGIAELAGALGLILPAATRILPALTPVAAAALALVMVLAAFFHVSRGEFLSVIPVLALGALALFVVWGRTVRVPISART